MKKVICVETKREYEVDDDFDREAQKAWLDTSNNGLGLHGGGTDVMLKGEDRSPVFAPWVDWEDRLRPDIQLEGRQYFSSMARAKKAFLLEREKLRFEILFGTVMADRDISDGYSVNMRRKDLFFMVGLPWDADQAEIEEAYKHFLANCHPDTAKKKEWADLFPVLFPVFSLLRDPNLRLYYMAYFGLEGQEDYHKHIKIQNSGGYLNNKYVFSDSYYIYPSPLTWVTDPQTGRRIKLTEPLREFPLELWEENPLERLRALRVQLEPVLEAIVEPPVEEPKAPRPVYVEPPPHVEVDVVPKARSKSDSDSKPVSASKPVTAPKPAPAHTAVPVAASSIEPSEPIAVGREQDVAPPVQAPRPKPIPTPPVPKPTVKVTIAVDLSSASDNEMDFGIDLNDTDTTSDQIPLANTPAQRPTPIPPPAPTIVRSSRDQRAPVSREDASKRKSQKKPKKRQEDFDREQEGFLFKLSSMLSSIGWRKFAPLGLVLGAGLGGLALALKGTGENENVTVAVIPEPSVPSDEEQLAQKMNKLMAKLQEMDIFGEYLKKAEEEVDHIEPPEAVASIPKTAIPAEPFALTKPEPKLDADSIPIIIHSSGTASKYIDLTPLIEKHTEPVTAPEPTASTKPASGVSGFEVPNWITGEWIKVDWRSFPPSNSWSETWSTSLPDADAALVLKCGEGEFRSAKPYNAHGFEKPFLEQGNGVDQSVLKAPYSGSLRSYERVCADDTNYSGFFVYFITL